MRVLIAEDSDIERMILEEAVEGLGHECVAAADGLQAWELFQRTGADVLVSDWLMPGLDGPELCRRVRAHPGAPYTYIVLLTALEGKEPTLTGMSAGADDYLTKPLNLDDLEARLIAAARVTALHQQLSGRARERERSLARRQALLGFAQRLAAEADPDRVLADVLTEATVMLSAAGGTVARWDDAQRVLVTVRTTLANASSNLPEAMNRAIGERTTIVLRDLGIVAVPLRHEDRILGALAVTGDGADNDFTSEARDVLEQLASTGAAALVGLERARIEGALLAMQTLQPGRATGPEVGRASLPVQATQLIGRQKELDLLRRLLTQEEARLITLTGPAGIGKTRLAVAAAATLADEFDGRVAFVDLVSVAEPGQVLSEIAQVLGSRGLDPTAAAAWLREALGYQPVLVVLDNLEHLLESASDVVALVRDCPRLRVLATSREALNVQAERQLAVPPLALADFSKPLSLSAFAQTPAIALFVQRAQAADPTFTLTEENARMVAEICARLDGLPLAIELAAARTRVLPTWSLPARLEQESLSVLTGGLRDQPARHQTLRAAIAWSYDLLNHQEQRHFRQLGVFVGGFTLAGASAVAEIGDHATPEAVGALVAKNLATRVDVPGSDPRFRLLETIRQYALEQLTAAGELEAAQARHAAYFASVAERAEHGSGTPEQAAWLDRLEREHDNLRAALRWAAQPGRVEIELRLASGLAWYWESRGHVAEGRMTTRRALERRGANVSPGVRGAALAAAATLAISDGDWSAARSALEQRLALVGRDPATLAGLALVRARAGERGAARNLADEALRLAEEVGDRRAFALASHVLGELATERGAFVQAQSHFATSLGIWVDLGDRLQLARTLEACAMLASARTHAARALRLAGAADTLRAAIGASRGRDAEEALNRWLQVARQSVDPEVAEALLAEGASLTPEQAMELAQAPVEPEMALVASETTRVSTALPPLSERETEVAVLVARGWTNKQIAAELNLSERTIEAHLRRILTRLGFATRTPLAAWVAQQGGLRAAPSQSIST